MLDADQKEEDIVPTLRELDLPEKRVFLKYYNSVMCTKLEVVRHHLRYWRFRDEQARQSWIW